MYFEIENTPEHIRKSRRTETVIKKSPKEEHPRLILAPFSKPAKVVFEDVPIGTSCERTLEVFNPSKQVQQITLGRALPAGLILHLPEEWLVLEPETCYCLTLLWTPIQPLALRDTIRFVSENRGRYDVIVVLKTGFNVKGKGKHSKVSKISPGKIEKKSFKRSPVGVCKKKAETIYNSTKNQKIVKSFQTTQHILKPSNKDNISTNSNYSLNSQYNKCPFDSPASIDFNFDTSEIFSNMRQLKSEKYLQNTYDKCPNVTETQNVLKPCNKQSIDVSATDLFDNLTFTPLKTIPAKNDNLNKGPKIIISMNSDSDFDDSLNVKNSNKENETHSIISITSTQPPNKWVVVNHQTQIDKQYTEMCALQTKKIPNTSSPKELNSPNFSINTELSRISDLSFFPQRFSTERKGLPRLNNDTHDIDEANIKLSSDTYTKYSPNTPIDFQMYTVESKPPHYFTREQQPKMCRQALFKEYYQQREIRDRNQIQTNDLQNWQNDTKSLSRPNSPTPLQSIPEESTQNTDTQLHDKTDKMSTFTINRTFDRDYSERPSMSATSRQSWSKKSVRAEPELWKVPASLAKKPKPSLKALKPKPSLKARDSFGSRASSTFEVNNKSVNQNTSLSNHIGNVYSQSFTLDPFLSTTYFYDEEAVCKFEKEFKRWLNCILTPPADLESNVEQKVDVGKAWLENRNKEVPLAPTKEQVCSVYHNSHRLKSLRRAARALLMSPEISLVFLKLNAQIEKKLIAIRIDRNLHLDVGLQKIIMELLLSYNPLWLRIGLEAIYGIILPLKSNSDIEGITTFIIQRMFKNPFLKNKHSKSNVPNMLLPAYMEAIKKFTLKKFLMLVFFLDQAKQRKLIPHDPCLFCRNAVCKESRDILIRFTRELIAGIGDITKHLRPLGYIVCHKQSYLDEYKYAVNNIAIDLRDGVRLSKVMEIILMKNGLLHQLRTPAISRLQKIHNVQVALNALKEANFVIVGDITAHDIADGHREKTLSLLWQLIHVFRAPLFEKAAGVIQMWWKKKYQVIIEKRKVEEQLRERLSTSAIIIQRWWRRIQYDRLVEWQMQQVTKATIVIQKYIRRWLFRRHYLNMKKSVLKIEVWYKSMKMIEEAKKYLDELKTEHENLRQRSAIVIQSYVRRWLCMRRFRSTLKKVVLMQSLSRRFLVRKEFLLLKKYTILIQQKYRSKLLMKLEMNSLAEKKRSAIIIQKYWRMLKEYRNYKKYKQAVNIIQTQYRAFIKMRQDRIYYTVLKNSVVIVQSLYRRRKACKEYARQREIIVKLQRRIRARQLMKKERINFLKMKTAASIIQSRFRAYLRMKLIRNSYIMKRNATRTIQNYFRAYLCAKSHREYYINLRNSVLVIQKHYRNVILMRKQRAAFLMLRRAVLCIQRRYRARVLTIQCKLSYQKLRFATVAIQRRFIALLEMRKERSRFLKLKSACIGIQKKYRALLAGRRVREHFVLKKQAAIKIQNWFRSSFETKKVKQQYQQSKNACITIQRIYRAYFIGRKERQEYLRIRTSVLRIQTYYRCYIEMKIVRQQYLQLRTATVTIQRYYKSYIEMKKERSSYLKIKTSVCLIENYYKRYKETQRICQQYYRLRECTLFIQRRYRSKCLMRRDREQFIELRKAIIYIQNKFRALREMKKQKDFFEKLRQASIVIQRAVRAHMLMKQDRNRYLETLKACTLIQTYYRSYRAGKIQREKFLQVKQSCIVLQQRYRALLMMRKERKRYLELRKATLIIQQRFRAHRLMVQERTTYLKILKACIVIQNAYKSTLACRKQMLKYKEMKSAAICIQRYYRCLKETRTIRNRYLALKKTALFIQYKFRANKIAREARRNRAASKIQIWYRSNQKRIEYRNSFLCLRTSAIKIQSVFRMYTIRKRFIAIKHATLTIQRFYRLYKLTTTIRLQYINTVKAIIKLQAFIRSRIANKRFLRVRNAALTIQAAYRLKKHNDILKARRETAAICIQKNVRKYLVQSRYHQYRKRIIYVQKLWRYKLLTRLMRCEFLQKRNSIIKLQAIIRGYLIRKQVQLKRESLSKIKEAKKRYWAASKIQALFRGHKARMNVRGDRRVTELRRRWREGALNSNQESMKERNEEAMEVLRNISDIETVIRAFRSLELLTEVFPMMYHDNASSIVTRVYIYMSVTNRSISSIEVLKSAASVLVNLTRYRITGPKIYARDRIPPILKFMWRFSNSETHLFCILSTYIWLFSKYDDVKKDLTEFLHMPENHKILTTIKGNVGRMKRMASNSSRNKFHTPQPSKTISHTSNMSLIQSFCSISGNFSTIIYPALEPDYGIVRVDKPRYFEDAQQAISCLFETYKL